MDPKAHWEKVYASRSARQVSWFQPHAERSLALIERIAQGRRCSVVDIGGGASTLVDDLLARHAVRPLGHVIVAAFGPDGPLQCSGLPVMRYAPDALHAQFGNAFELIEHQTESHHTPGGAVQQFVYCLCVLH